jgi:hypothetical protein
MVALSVAVAVVVLAVIVDAVELRSPLLSVGADTVAAVCSLLRVTAAS